MDLEKDKVMDSEALLKDKETVVKVFIQQELINKALYKQYGGRIIVQQMGAEPYDAMHQFPKEEEKNGSFMIIFIFKFYYSQKVENCNVEECMAYIVITYYLYVCKRVRH